jgi:hypothetical protein
MMGNPTRSPVFGSMASGNPFLPSNRPDNENEVVT